MSALAHPSTRVKMLGKVDASATRGDLMFGYVDEQSKASVCPFSGQYVSGRPVKGVLVHHQVPEGEAGELFPRDVAVICLSASGLVSGDR